MWKVLIADDEPKIRRGLRSLLEHSCEDIEVVAEGEDGADAYDKALEFEPDILLIDVCMPIKNGLDLVEDLRLALPGRIIIIVSGHDEFEYAQAAVKLQAFDYVLKPIEAAGLVSVIRKACAELESRRLAGEYESWAKAQLQTNLPIIRERFFRDWFGAYLPKGEILQTMKLLEIDLPSPLALIEARFPEQGRSLGSESDVERRLKLAALRAIYDANMPEGSYIFEDDEESIVTLAPGLGEESLTELAERLEAAASEKIGRAPSLASRLVSDPLSSLEEVHEELKTELTGGDGCESFVVMARNYIDKYYYNPDLSLEDAAGELQVSPGYLSRLMKRETGFSFVEYLNHVRVRKATALMMDPAAKAFEVAERVGYRSQHYFSRAFKKVTGNSPTDCRKGLV